MSITSGIGLFSGIDSASLIEQLVAIDARPRVFAQQRIVQLQTQQAAFLSINSALSGLKTAADVFAKDKIFDKNGATSSNTELLTATAGNSAAEGSYSFLVDRLVTTQQRLSRGFTDADESGIGATEFTFELGAGGIGSETSLSELNGGLGIERGKIVITDRSGASATVDLSKVVTVDDVLDAINGASGIDVQASVGGDGLIIEDKTGQTAGNLIVENSFGGGTATSLGIESNVAADTITGSDIRFISGGTALALLNDGNGIHIVDGDATPDFEIKALDGTSILVNLGRLTETQEIDGEDVEVVLQSRATTIQDVIDIINTTASDGGADVTASLSADGLGITIDDNTGGGGTLEILSTSNRTTAEDLGLVASTAGTQVVGTRLLSSINSTLVKNLNGGSGLSASSITISDRAAAPNSVTFDLSASALTGSLSDIIEEINAAASGAGVQVSAQLNRAGNGIALVDSSGGTNDLVVSGAAATELGLETAGTAASYFDGSNLQHAWIGLGTKLDDLNVGKGIGTGTIRITDSAGISVTADVGSTLDTVGDLISFLNSRPSISVVASINDSGDGIVITDAAGGSSDLKIEDISGTVARDLNIAGEFAESGGVTQADGSYERRVSFDATDTLTDIVDKINQEGLGVSASIINDGGSSSPFRISLTSKLSGVAGRAIVDTGGFDLGLDTLSAGDNAIVFFGSDDPAKAVLLSSSTNTLDNVVSGVTIDLKGTSDEPIEVVISRDTEAIEAAIEGFVEAFNGVIETITAHTFFDVENERRGALMGDTTTNNVKTALLRTVQGNPEGVDGQFQFLFQAGVRIGSGSQLEFDRERFRTALETDFDDVKNLFSANKLAPNEPIEIAPGATVPATETTFLQLGVGGQIRELVDGFVNSVDGLLTLRDKTLDTQIELQETRIEGINRQLDVKRATLQRQFLSMEQALASLSSQQSALSSIQLIG